MTGTALHHRGQDLRGDLQKADDVGLDHPEPRREVAVLQPLLPHREACIVDQQVDLAPLLKERGEPLLDRIVVTHVEGEDLDLPGEPGHQLVKAFLAPPESDHAAARLAEGLAAGTADATGGTGDENGSRHLHEHAPRLMSVVQ